MRSTRRQTDEGSLQSSQNRPTVIHSIVSPARLRPYVILALPACCPLQKFVEPAEPHWFDPILGGVARVCLGDRFLPTSTLMLNMKLGGAESEYINGHVPRPKAAIQP